MFNIQVARGVYQNLNNTIYSDTVEITSLDDLKAAVMFDHVGAVYQNGKRSIENFLWCDCLIMDVDNDHTEKSSDWVTPERLSKIFLPNINFFVIFSKSHNKIKKNPNSGKEYSPRPRYHVYFTLSQKINKPKQLRALKESLLHVCPAFDSGAKDAARLLFGVQNPDGLEFKGDFCVDEFLNLNSYGQIFNLPNRDDKDTERNTEFEKILKLDGLTFLEAIMSVGVIPTGYRDNTLLKVADVALLAKGDEVLARPIFDTAVKKCEGKISKGDISRIWRQAINFTKKAKKQKHKDEKNHNMLERRLTQPILEKTLTEKGIKLRLNIIKGEIEVDNLPFDNNFIQESFSKLSKQKQKNAAPHLLPLYLNDMLKRAGYEINYALLKQRISGLSLTNEFNPVVDTLQGTKWDGVNRMPEIARILGIEHNEFYITLIKKWLVQAVAMAFNEGENSNEFCLVFKGGQGIGKTSFFRVISLCKERPEFFKEAGTLDMRIKDDRITATSYWITELGELDATLEKKQTDLKGFLTNSYDDYRRPYSETYEHKPRHTVFCATLNDDGQGFLYDLSGNRRWAVVEIKKIDKKALRELSTDWIKQLWAQVYAVYLREPKDYFRLNDDDLALVEKNNSANLIRITGETELLDKIKWNTPEKDWVFYTASEIIELLELKNISAVAVGRALTKIGKDDPRVVKKNFGHKVIKYFLPEIPQYYRV